MKRICSAVMFALSLSLWSTTFTAAHPLGNFSVNRYSRIEVTRDAVQLRYVLDLAEIPTLQELRSAGIQPGAIDPASREALLAAKSRELMAGAQLAIGGQPVSWSLEDADLSLLPGQAELDTLRVVLTLSASTPVPEGARLEYRDVNYPGRTGWHEVVEQGGEGIDLADATVGHVDQTNELRAYPVEAERAPLDVSSAAATAKWSTSTDGSNPSRGSPLDVAATRGSESRSTISRLALDPRADQLAALLREGTGAAPLTILLALAVAAGLGALHAFEPGHGKTVVGSYLVGSRGTARHAVLLGLTVTVTHTLGVYALGLVTLVAAQYILPERLYPILGIVSGGLVVVIGLSMVRARLGGLGRPRRGEITAPHSHFHESPAAHEHLHEAHGYGLGQEAHHHVHADQLLAVEHSHGDRNHVHPHDAHDLTHAHAHTHEPHGHVHAHEVHPHDHVHGLHEHVHAIGSEHEHASSPAQRTSLHPDAGLPHSHGWGPSHSHAMPGMDGSPVTMKSLLALGISGGLLPCPSALVVLLAAISFQNVGLGMLLVAAFSVGLATVLTGIGLLIVFGGRALGRLPLAERVGQSPLFRAVPALGAVAITLAGLAIATQAASTLL